MDGLRHKVRAYHFKKHFLFWIISTCFLLISYSYLWSIVSEHFFHQLIVFGAFVLLISLFFYYFLNTVLTAENSLRFILKKALKNKEFYPVYQPIYNTHHKDYLGVEVLLRWRTRNEEILMPDLFIREAEETGLIIPISLHIMEIAFQELYPILNKNPLFHTAFNISALHFTDPDFFNSFYKMIAQYHINPQQILLEITERDLLEKNNEVFVNQMQKLRHLNISLAIDDYGIGYSSITYLQFYPFNFLKIDKLFIQAIGTKAITESLNDAIIDLAKRVGLIVIAEGVETQEQVDYLLKNQIPWLQGWYFSKALSIKQLKQLLAKGESHEQ